MVDYRISNIKVAFIIELVLNFIYIFLAVIEQEFKEGLFISFY